MSADILESVREIVEPIVTAEGMELVYIEYRRERRGWVLRFYVDKQGGVTIEDCSNISRQVNHLMDIDELIPHSYVLEVSSPGLGIPLKREDDFIKHKGKLVRFKTDVSIGKWENFKGRLLDYEDGILKIKVGDEVISLPFNKILKANLVYEF